MQVSLWFKRLALSTPLLLPLWIYAAPASSGRAQTPDRQAPSNATPLLSAAVIPAFLRESVKRIKGELLPRLAEDQRGRAGQGIDQAAAYWRPEDGSPDAFEAFVRQHLIAQPSKRDALFHRLEVVFEQLEGHMHEINRELRRPTDLDLGPVLPIDALLGGYNPSAHLVDDLFANKLAFMVLLNFPLHSLEEKVQAGDRWSRQDWAETRLAQRFSRRVPADVQQDISTAVTEADRYISEYNIWMHHLMDEDGKRLFPPKLRLISHWNLRDEIKASYSDPNGLPRQRMIQRVMEQIVTQSIPAVVVNNPHVDWKPFANQVTLALVNDSDDPSPASLHVSPDPEPNTRYAHLLNVFRAVRRSDAYSPTAPTHIARRFNEDREIPEERVHAMLHTVLSSPLLGEVARVIEARVGRPLEPFDIWYNGFRPRGKYTEEQLDAIVKERYSSVAAFTAQVPALLQGLGFSKARSEYLAARIEVDPARGAGHAMGAVRREDKAHLRTRFEKDGMNYKGFNVAIHELGHNVEQVFSLNDIDHTLIQGVPNTAFTEAIAFVFQAHDLQLLGLSSPDPMARALGTLNDYWATAEICAVALVDMEVWHWMYAHSEATPAELRDATERIAHGVWNRYYAPIFKKKDVVLLGIYSHMIDALLYLPDYPVGHLIAHQIEEQIEKAGNLGTEVERMARIGAVAPDLWMRQATGAPVGPESLLRATEKALHKIDTRH